MRPSLTLQVDATTNATPNEATRGKKDAIITVRPAIEFHLQGARTSLSGNWGVDALQYVRNSQTDTVMPHGQSQLRWISPLPNTGIELNASAAQVSSTFGTPVSGTPSSQDTYTNLNYGIAPFLSLQFNELWRLQGRLERSALHIIGQDTSLANRTGSRTSTEHLALERTPSPFGIGLIVNRQSTETPGQSTPTLEDTSTQLRLSRQEGSELTWGAGFGRTRNLSNGATLDEHTRSLFVQWHPTARTMLNAESEHRYFGPGWSLQAQHRMPWLVLNLTSSKKPVTYASSLGNLGANVSLRDLYDAMLTTRYPDATERDKAVDDLLSRRQAPLVASSTGALYDLQARLQDATRGSIALMGRRDVLTVVGSLSRTRPLPIGDGLSLASDTTATKQYVLDTQWSHQLTPMSSLSMGAAWTRSTSVSTSPVSATLARTFSMRTAYNTRLTQSTSTFLGLRRSINHGQLQSNTDETAMYMGLSHLF